MVLRCPLNAHAALPVQVLPADVDYRVMRTFLEFYHALLQFVNFKLYHALGVKYPPVLDPRLEQAAAGLAALMQVLALTPAASLIASLGVLSSIGQARSVGLTILGRCAAPASKAQRSSIPNSATRNRGPCIALPIAFVSAHMRPVLLVEGFLIPQKSCLITAHVVCCPSPRRTWRMFQNRRPPCRRPRRSRRRRWSSGC